VHVEQVPGADHRRFVVCGDNPLALRLVDELVNRYDASVAAIVRLARGQTAQQIARLPNVQVVQADHLDAAAFRAADLANASGLALVDQDDVGNVDAALLAQELHPGLRLVIRMFNPNLGTGVRRLLTDCAVLSSSAIAVPAFVAATLGEGVPTYLQLPDGPLVLARRSDVRFENVVCGVAITEGREEPELLPASQHEADMVLAVAEPTAHRRKRTRHPFHTMSLLIGRRLRLVLGVFAALILAGGAILATTEHVSWLRGAYLAILTSLGAANPDVKLSSAEQITQTVLVISGLALIPVVTAAVVEVVVNARLARASGGLFEPMSDHVVVVGLGNLATQVIRALHDFGVAVVAVDKSEHSRGVQVARQLRTPVVIGDAGTEETLRAASVETCRALVVLSKDDMTNLETALVGRSVKNDLRVVLRLFDGAFADRVQRAFGITTSRSVSYLAAPAFAAALLGREIIDIVSVGRRVLLVAEIPVGASCSLEGRPVAEIQRPGETLLLAVRTGRGDQTLWSPPRGRLLVRTDRLLVIATRAGLGRLLADTAPPSSAPPPSAPPPSAPPPSAPPPSAPPPPAPTPAVPIMESWS
jgi:Trk K+ transport system NAD-binding subunit